MAAIIIIQSKRYNIHNNIASLNDVYDSGAGNSKDNIEMAA